MSRRFALIAALSAALLVPGTASAATAIVTVTDNHFTNASPTLALGGSVAWQPSGTSNLHSTTADKFGMWTYDLPGGSSTPTPDVVFDRAGGFAYHCRIHGSMRGTVMVQLSPNDTTPVVGQTITITFALNAASPGFAEQIQKRKAGGTWRTLSAANTGTSVAWMAPSAKTFQFRARLVQGGVMSSWSPTLQLTVTAS